MATMDYLFLKVVHEAQSNKLLTLVLLKGAQDHPRLAVMVK
jgi:hypothetical protein